MSVTMCWSSVVTVILVTLTSVWFLLSRKLRSLRTRDSPGVTRLCCVLGSGGHTTEMMKLVTSLPLETYSPRTYVMAETDRFSEAKVEELEKERLGEHVIVRVPRAREVTSSIALEPSEVIITIIFRWASPMSAVSSPPSGP